MAELGLMGITIDESTAAPGADTLSTRSPSRSSPGSTHRVAITGRAHTSLGDDAILLSGPKEQKARVGSRPRVGTAAGSVLALTEPGAGSDAGATSTRAELRDGQWVIDGAKTFITNAGIRPSPPRWTITARTGEDEVSTSSSRTGCPATGSRRPLRKARNGAPRTRASSRSTGGACSEENLPGRAATGFKQFLQIPTGGPHLWPRGVGLAQGAYDARMRTR